MSFSVNLGQLVELFSTKTKIVVTTDSKHTLFSGYAYELASTETLALHHGNEVLKVENTGENILVTIAQ